MRPCLGTDRLHVGVVGVTVDAVVASIVVVVDDDADVDELLPCMLTLMPMLMTLSQDYEMTGDGWKHPEKGWPAVAGLDLVDRSFRAC